MMKTFTMTLGVLFVLAAFAGTADAQVTVTSSVTSAEKGRPVVGTLTTKSGSQTLIGVSYSLAGGSLPEGVTLLPVGIFMGTPTTVGTATFNVLATWPFLQGVQGPGLVIAKISITVTAPPMSILTTSLPEGRIGATYGEAIAVEGGERPYVFGIVPADGAPPGLDFDTGRGELSGTPTVAGKFTFTITVTDSLRTKVSQEYTVVVTDDPSLEAAGTTEWTVNRRGFELAITATGGDGIYKFATPTGVPPGLTSSIARNVLTVEGTPKQAGQYTLSVTVKDRKGGTDTLETLISIYSPPEVAATPVPEATVGTEYAGLVTATKGTPPYAFSVLSVIPAAAWVGIDSRTGTIEGTPNATGTLSVTVRVEDATGAQDSGRFTIVVNEAPVLRGRRLAIAVEGAPFSDTPGVTGGTAPYVLSLDTGELPRGLDFFGQEIQGTPALPVHANLRLKVTDYWGAEAEADFELTVGRKYPVIGKFPASVLEPEIRRGLVFDLLAGTAFSVDFKVKTGMDEFYVTFLRGDGTTVDTSGFVKLGKTSLKLKKFPIGETGRYALLIANASRTENAEWSGKVKAKPTKKLKLVEGFGPMSDDLLIPFSALKGATISLSAKVAGKDVPVVDLISIKGPAGTLDPGAFLKLKGTGFKVAKLPIPASGDYVLRIGADKSGSADGTLKLQLKVKSPKEYTYSAD